MEISSFRVFARIPPLLNKGLIAGTTLLYKSYESGQVFCSFRRKVITPRGSELFMLDLSQNRFALWAMGAVINHIPLFHTFRAITERPIDIRFMVCKTQDTNASSKSTIEILNIGFELCSDLSIKTPKPR